MDRPAAIEPVMETEHPDLVVVQGDTTTTLAGAVGAFYQQIAVAHVEAGLRTGDMMQPFPEEMNRVLTSRIATWHFAPTARAEAALASEGRGTPASMPCCRFGMRWTGAPCARPNGHGWIRASVSVR